MFSSQQISGLWTHRITAIISKCTRRLRTIVFHTHFKVLKRIFCCFLYSNTDFKRIIKLWLLSNLLIFEHFMTYILFLLSSFILTFFRCAKDIDTLIESLPNEDSSQELQAQSLRRLEMENQEAAKRLEEVRLNISHSFYIKNILIRNFHSHDDSFCL